METQDVDWQQLRKVCCNMLEKNQESIKLADGTMIKIASVGSTGVGIETGISDEGWRRRAQSQ